MPRRKGDHTKTASRDARQRTWQSMRIHRQFTRHQIETATQPISRNNLEKFIRVLAKAKYLRCVHENLSGSPGSFKVWLLIRNSGPKRPIPWKDGRVFDPNTNKTYGENGEEIRD